MKKVMLLILAALMVIGLCSCKTMTHRKLQFDDGTSYCFKGSVNIYDEYISYGHYLNTEYISINERQYTITQCDCENINK